MNRNCLLNKILAMLLCAVLLIGYLPVSALPAAAATDDKWESEKDVLETTTEAPTEPETTVPEVEETTAPEAEEIVKTITFDETSKRIVGTTEQQVWVENGITVTNNKAGASSDVNLQYYNPVRFYKNSTVTVDCPGMTKIVWDSSASTQAGYLKTSIEAAADSNVTVSVSGQIVTIEFAEPVDTFLVTCSGGQCRASSMEIHAVSGSVTPETTVPEVEETTVPEVEETTEPTTEPLTPEQILNAAYALGSGESLEGTYTLTGVITAVDTAYNSQYSNVTVTMQVGDMTDKPIMCYRMKGDGADQIGVGDTITVTGTIMNYNGTVEFAANCTLDSWENTGIDENLTTPEEILGAAYALAAGESLQKSYTLTGVITSVDTAYSSQYSNVTVTMQVGDLTEMPIQCFRLKGTGADLIGVGDIITVTGGITNYNGKIQFTSGCMLDSYELVEPETTVPEVEETTEPEVEETTEPETEPALGSEQNPIFLFEKNNVVSNAGTVYYQGYFAGQTVTISGTGDFSVISEGETIPATEGSVVLTYPTVMGRPLPNVFAIVGDGEFTVNAAYPVGSMSNPATATLGDNVATIESGSGEYFFNYTAEYTGKLLVEISSADGNWQYTINNMTTYQYGDTQWSDSDPVVNPAEIDVTEGDIIEIKVITYDPADMWNIPAGEITVNLEYKPGSCAASAIFLTGQNDVVTNAGTVYYQGYFAGQTVTISGTGDFSVISEGETIPATEGSVVLTYPTVMGRPLPNVFAIVGDGEFTVNAAYPVGSMSNPATATLGDNVATIESGSGEYFFNYTAEYTGKLLVEISSADGNWQYTINNMTTYQYGDTQWSDSDPVVNPAEIDVTEGDIIEIKVITYDPADMWNIPAGDITVYLSYEPGTCEGFRYVLDKNMQTVTNAGTKYYLARHSGCRMVISGEGDFSINYNGEVISSVYGFISTEVYSANPFFNPVVFELTGDGDYTIEFIYPAGHANNPATAFLGDNTCSIEAGNSQGYYWTYTAEQTGELIVAVKAPAGWTYVVNNLTTGQYGDTQWSDSDPVVNPATIAVNEGDEIQIIVNTYDPADMWNNPAGEITLGLAYLPIPDGWVMEGGQWCYYIDGQKLTNGWAKDSSGWYYMGYHGRAVQNEWAMNEGGWMYLGSDKHPVKNAWTKDGAGIYYMGADGYAVKNTWAMNTKGWMYIGSDKHPVINDWAQDSAGWYFMGGDGYAVKNAWAKDSSGWYYMDETGRAVKNGWAKDSAGKLYMGADGHAVKNTWITVGGKKYFANANGYIVTGTQSIGGKLYTFDANGVLIG